MKAASHIPLLPAEEYERRQRRETSSVPGLWDLLDEVKDPEIPVISLWELGVLQDIALAGDTVMVTITPTYSGCPAMTVMAEDIVTALAAAGYHSTEIVTRLAPAWTSLWMSPEAKEKLRHYGIAPPGCGSSSAPEAIACPHCGSADVRKISEFGSTACKSLYQCGDCREPFDYFKPI